MDVNLGILKFKSPAKITLAAQFLHYFGQTWSLMI